MTGMRSTFWGFVVAISVTLIVSGAVALWNAGVVADKYHVTDGISPSLWLVFGTGVVGLVVSLPAYLAWKNNEKNDETR